MIVTFWGASATAKTTLATMIAEKLSVPLRSCGEEIRAAAVEAQVPLNEAPDALHRRVDEATRNWARVHSLGGGVIEGRFLDQVLANEQSVVLVCTTCRAAIRAERWAGRTGAAFSDADLTELDNADDLFRLRLYGSADKGAAHVTLDTSSGGVVQWTNELLTLIKEGRTAEHA